MHEEGIFNSKANITDTQTNKPDFHIKYIQNQKFLPGVHNNKEHIS